MLDEYNGTRHYAENEPDGLGWSATVGEDAVAVHMGPTVWGWNARGASRWFLGVELAQPLEQYAITDAQVRALCWYIRHEVLPAWPDLEATILAHPKQALPTHAELDGTAIYGGTVDGKTDVYSRGSAHADELRVRIVGRLADRSWSI